MLRSSAGETQSTLMIAKARVAPLKSPTIPRMELTAASVAVKMDKLLKKELELELHESIYSDPPGSCDVAIAPIHANSTIPREFSATLQF